DQDRRARPFRARGEVQPAAAHRGAAGRRGALRGPFRIPAVPGLTRRSGRQSPDGWEGRGTLVVAVPLPRPAVRGEQTMSRRRAGGRGRPGATHSGGRRSQREARAARAGGGVSPDLLDDTAAGRRVSFRTALLAGALVLVAGGLRSEEH